MRKIILGIFAITILFFGAGEIYAQCDCINNYASAYDEFKGSDAVFVGEVIETKKIRDFNTEASEFEVKFKVEAAWKTDSTETVTLKNTARGDSEEFKKGESYLVYVRIRNNELRANYGCCTKTKLLSDAAKDVQEFKDNCEKQRNIIKESPKDNGKPNNSAMKETVKHGFQPLRQFV